MRYTPGSNIQKTKNISYTEGYDYMFLSGQNYVGYYHTYNNNIYSNKIHDANSNILYEYNNDVNYIKYLQLKPTITTHNLITYTPQPTPEDYVKQFITRYFIKKRNDVQIYEVDKNEYGKLNNKKTGVSKFYYNSVELEWKITGVISDVYVNNILTEHGIEDTNKRTVKMKNSEMDGLILHFTNYLEFAHINQ